MSPPCIRPNTGDFNQVSSGAEAKLQDYRVFFDPRILDP